ncbi:MAG: polyhydroxyalkanoate synthesis repressor PhaR, partial [Pseudomonadota bacterium]
TDLVRSYTTQATSMVPDFLAASFEILQKGQSQMMQNMAKANPLAGMPSMPGMEAMRAQQEAFMKAMTGGLAAMGTVPGSDSGASDDDEEDLDAIKEQLADLQEKLSKLGK